MQNVIDYTGAVTLKELWNAIHDREQLHNGLVKRCGCIGDVCTSVQCSSDNIYHLQYFAFIAEEDESYICYTPYIGLFTIDLGYLVPRVRVETSGPNEGMIGYVSNNSIVLHQLRINESASAFTNSYNVSNDDAVPVKRIYSLRDICIMTLTTHPRRLKSAIQTVGISAVKLLICPLNINKLSGFEGFCSDECHFDAYFGKFNRQVTLDSDYGYLHHAALNHTFPLVEKEVGVGFVNYIYKRAVKLTDDPRFYLVNAAEYDILYEDIMFGWSISDNFNLVCMEGGSLQLSLHSYLVHIPDTYYCAAKWDQFITEKSERTGWQYYSSFEH